MRHSRRDDFQGHPRSGTIFFTLHMCQVKRLAVKNVIFMLRVLCETLFSSSVAGIDVSA